MIAIQAESSFQLQRTFTEAIFADAAPIPASIRAASGPASASRFGVYRNNVIASLINAVAARYPVVRKLLWDDAFERVARLYVTAEPPRSPVLQEYGASFPHFLRRLGQGIAADYLADIAELEAARTGAYHAADVRPLDRGALAAIPLDRLEGSRLKLHPSAALLHSRYPVVSIWEANVYAHDNTIREWKPEPVLVARPGLRVEVHRLSAGSYEFLAALARGRTVGSAITQAMDKVVGFDLTECFAVLIAAEIVVEIQPPPDPA